MENVVGYFEYSDEERAREASLEQEKIMKLEKQINYDNPKVVYSLYNKMIIGNVFSTPEGILYLVHLQDYLSEHESELPGGIMSIPAEDFFTVEQVVMPEPTHKPETKSSSEILNGEKSIEDYEKERIAMLDKIRGLELERSKAYKTLKVKSRKTDNLIYKIIIGALAVLVIVMMIISLASNSPTILNYRQKIQNEYADWEQQLSDKERELNRREKALDGNETPVNNQIDIDF